MSESFHQLEAKCASLRSQVEQQKAEIAALKAEREDAIEKEVLENEVRLRAENAALKARAERAEAEVAKLGNTAMSVAMDGTDCAIALGEAIARAERAEAEVKVLRELLEMLQSAQWLRPAQRKAIRATLQQTSPAKEE